MPLIYFYALASVLVVSLISLIGIATLSFKEGFLRKYIFVLVSLAIGALLGDAFIHLIPEAFADMDATLAGLLVLGGMFLFLVFEKILHWHHHLSGEGESYCDQGICKPGDKIHPVGHITIVSDGIHNLLDGIIIGASYLVSVEVGIATTIAVILHEIPQEIGDFGVLLHAGFSKMKALLVNLLSALLAIVGAIVVLVLNESAQEIVRWLVPISAGGFIYIAASDLIPEMHKIKETKHSLLQIAAIIIGVSAMFLLVFAETEKENLPTEDPTPIVYRGTSPLFETQ
ncbi:MAG TPA: ZIP family metal transporter [Candidatus Paceibacterota bacterium]